jgi:N-acetylglutamate synthase-like GNAT family acetyltransferase
MCYQENFGYLVMSKTNAADEIIIEQVPDLSAPPMDLLLLADPDPHSIQSYIDFCLVLRLLHKGRAAGVLAMSPESKEKAEIRNIAIIPEYREKGFARLLLEEAFTRALRLGYSSVQVSISNAHIRPFKIFQQYGFELTDIRWNYYAQHHSEQVMEDGILCRHQLVLSVPLHPGELSPLHSAQP